MVGPHWKMWRLTAVNLWTDSTTLEAHIFGCWAKWQRFVTVLFSFLLTVHSLSPSFCSSFLPSLLSYFSAFCQFILVSIISSLPNFFLPHSSLYSVLPSLLSYKYPSLRQLFYPSCHWDFLSSSFIFLLLSLMPSFPVIPSFVLFPSTITTQHDTIFPSFHYFSIISIHL